MPYLTDLADACRKGGLRVREQRRWKTRGHGPMGAPRGIIVHHTAGPRTGNYPSLRVVRDGRPGLPGPLSQLGLARDGSVYVIAAGLAYHAGDGSHRGLRGNWDCIGIEAESTGTGDWTRAQIDAYPRLVAALVKHYGIPLDNVIGHYEWTSRKIDPYGWPGRMPGFRRTVGQILGGGALEGYDPPGPPPPPPAPEPEPLEWYEMTEIPQSTQQTIRNLARLAAVDAIREMLPTIVEAVGRDRDRYHRGTVQGATRAVVDASLRAALTSPPAEFVDLAAAKAASAVWSAERAHPNLPGVVTTQSAVAGSTYRAVTRIGALGGLASAEAAQAVVAEADAELAED